MRSKIKMRNSYEYKGKQQKTQATTSLTTPNKIITIVATTSIPTTTIGTRDICMYKKKK